MTIVLANAGLPMLVLTGPVMVLAFPIVVTIERFVVGARLRLSRRSAWRVSLVANAASTLVGVPATWVFLVILQMIVGGGEVQETDSTAGVLYQVFVQAAWQPGDDGPLWTVPAAALMLHVPFLITSVYVERWVAVKLLLNEEINRAATHRALWIANGVTYSLLAAFWGVVLWRQIVAG